MQRELPIMKHTIWILVLVFTVVFSSNAQDSHQQEEIEDLRSNCLGRFGDTGKNMELCLNYATCLVETPDANCPDPYQQGEIRWFTDTCLSSYVDSGNTAALCSAYATCLVMTPMADCLNEQVILQYEDCLSMELDDCEAYSILLLSKSNLPFSNFLSEEERNLRSMAFRSYLAGDYEEAVSYMQEIFVEQEVFYRFYYYILPIAYGILQSRNELYEEAIASYTLSIQVQYDNPLAYYFRAQAYAALGDVIHAGRDAYTYQVQASESLKATFTPLDVIFERPDMQNWVAYPVVGLGSSPGGESISDLTLREPISVEFAVLDNATIALTSLFTTNDKIEFLPVYNSDSEIPYAFIPDRIQYAIVRGVQGYPGVCCGEGSGLVLTDYGDYFVYTSYNYGGESGFETWGVLFPVDFPDPRESLPPRACEGLPRTHLTLGDNVAYWALAAYSEPSNESERLSVDWEETTAIITEGPICTEDSIWWQIEYGEDNSTGWVRENNGERYALFPLGYMIQRDVRTILGLDLP